MVAALAQSHDNKWRENFALLQAYYELYSTFPMVDVVYQGVKLGKWCAEQKRCSKTTAYPPERIHKLKKMGLIK